MDGVVAVVVGLAGGLILTPIARRVAIAFDIVDRPGELKPQRVPIAYLGGVAVAVAAAGGAILTGRPLVLVPMAAALLLGLADDLRPLAVSVRIAVELAIAAGSALVVPGPPLARIATALLVLGLLNAVNLLDGQDGLAAGVGIAIGSAFAVLGGAATPLGLGLAGALLGFLVLNRPPARIYLGDAGAYFVGTTIALLPALTRHSATRWSIWWAVPLLVAVPVADTAIAIVRRLRAHRPLLSGDRSHVYDQLVDRGMSIGGSTMVVVAAQVLLGAVGLAATRAAPGVALTITVGTAFVVTIVVVRAGLLTTGSDSDAGRST
ncbi:MAG: MraY family glycosyltransferase [Acidimicrobiia bacterium]